MQLGLGIRVREHVTGLPASSEGVTEPARHSGAAWWSKPCGRCTACRLSAFHKSRASVKVEATQCAILVKVGLAHTLDHSLVLQCCML